MKYSINSKHTSLRLTIALLLVILSSGMSLTAVSKTLANRYVIGVREALKQDHQWMEVVNQLKQNHPGADVAYYKHALTELLPALKKKQPRYLCVVETPDRIDKNFVIEGNRMSRQMDDDIYDDYVWGIVTGCSAKDALRMATQSKSAFTIRTALTTTSEVASGIWFNRMAGISDGTKLEWFEKKSKTDRVHTYKMDRQFRSLGIFMDKWQELDPDIIFTSSHATQNNLEMPFSSGNLRARNGQLYADFFVQRNVPSTNKPRVYMPIGNCLIGDMNASDKSMAAAWLSSGGATAMLGYVVSTWYGRNGWGALKFLLSAPGRHTIAEAAFLNRQDMYTQLQRKNPTLNKIVPDFRNLDDNSVRTSLDMMTDSTHNLRLDRDDVGFLYDRDVVAYYGDPAWNVRTQEVAGAADYAFSCVKNGKQTVIMLKTGPRFSMDKVKGKGFKEEHVKDIPVAYFLPERILSPRVVGNPDNLDIALDENFILIYNQNLKPNQIYTLTVE